MTFNKATAIGLVAILLWSTIVGLMRSVTGALGAVGGAAMIYTLSSLILILTVGFPKISKFPRKYLIWGGLLFVVYELCLSLSVGLAKSDSQAIEVSMVNYLWPSMTLLLACIADGKKLRPLMLGGMLVCLAGVGKVIGGANGLSIPGMIDNLASNPISYGLAFSGAIIWSFYCVLTKKIAEGCNGITLFFMLTAAVLWLKFSLSDNVHMDFTPTVIVNLLLVAGSMGLGYAAWNTGILHGNVTVLATASYFIPVLSALFAALLLGESLGYTFWIGALMVSFGSVLCWWVTRKREY
ncbi:aromatic amino acid DMT transporter YddG [Rosenbergiella australiborealis]|uniref:Aromatic amino acid DMT transporter YddG n=1 Tax=Rosenbergiella australiborealis TaxID=1544696 RepID=A0ABS5T5R2_9GAMM|nr:aromatic amino acid DMT transporter YddG [Rosenbergiella australiborealis]MBT0726855.1 aromatic amino acid DMT transporter YddG [Rosenbergiella australiborealis]